MITNIIDLMRALDYVQGSQSLSADEKATIAKELRGSLPAKALCHGAHSTFEIAAALFEKAASVPARTNGPSEREAQKDNPGPQEARQEEHKFAPGSKTADVFPRDAGKAHGGAKKVARG